MIRHRLLILASILLVLFIYGCSGNGGGSPITPTPEAKIASEKSGTTGCLGFWQVTVDTEKGTIDAVDMRSSDLIVNVLTFLEPPVLTGMTINFGTLDIDPTNKTIDVDVIITHPIPDPVFTGFDVRGVVFGPKLANADGLTIIPSPEFFTGVPFGYKNGLLGTPDSTANYTGLAGYKYFCDALGPDDDLAAFMSDSHNLADRGRFSEYPHKNLRHYTLDWNNASHDFFVFNYAIYANYNWPVGEPPITLDDFDITTANSAEAFCAKIEETGNSLWYAEGSGGGGAISLRAEVWDWQGDISNVTLESVETGVMPQTPYTNFIGAGSTDKSYVYEFADIPAAPTAMGDLDLLITVTDPKTFGEAWFMGLLPQDHSMYDKYVYNCWLYTATVDSCPEPKPTSTDPGGHVVDNIPFAMIVNGTDFVPGSSLAVKLKRTGQADIPATNVQYVDSTKISCDMTLPFSAALGLWDVEVVNGCGTVGIGIGLFDVGCPTPVVTSIYPDAHAGDNVQFFVYITGNDFMDGSSLAVALSKTGETNIDATDVTWINNTKIACYITIPLGTEIGLWNVEVTNGCGGAPGVGHDLFTVSCPTPGVTNIDPDTHAADNAPFAAIITGSNFVDGSSLAVALTKAGQPDIDASEVAWSSSTKITCEFTIPSSAASGLWNVQVTNGCGGTPGKGNNMFTVTCPTPGVTDIDPDTHAADDVQFQATITGSDFIDGTDVAVALTKNGQSDINATNVVVSDANEITCDLTIPSGTVTGLWNVRVTNGCGGTPGTGNNLFTVTEPFAWNPTVSLSPGEGSKVRDDSTIPLTNSSYDYSTKFNVSGDNATGGGGGSTVYEWFASTSNSDQVGGDTWHTFTFNNGGSFTVSWPDYTAQSPSPMWLWVRAKQGSSTSTPVLCTTQMDLSETIWAWPDDFTNHFDTWTSNSGSIWVLTSSNFYYSNNSGSFSTGTGRAWTIDSTSLTAGLNYTFEWSPSNSWTPYNNCSLQPQYGTSSSLGTALCDAITNANAGQVFTHDITPSATDSFYLGYYGVDSAWILSSFYFYVDNTALYRNP